MAKPTCVSCGGTITKQDFRLITGFTKISRAGGGTNSVALKEIVEPRVYKCRWCVEHEGRGHVPGQESLL